MNRKAFLSATGSAAVPMVLPRRLWAKTRFQRRRPTDAAWPPVSEWKRLNNAVGGNVRRVEFPLSILKSDPKSDAAKRLVQDLHNPYYIGDQPGLTQTLGWIDAWSTRPSVYAVAARNAADIAHAVNFARENDLRLVVKGGGHSYQGTSNAPDSLLIWTRDMHDITMHDRFVPQGCEHLIQPVPAVTIGAGAVWMQAYQAVTTQGGKYVQGGGCATVGVAGLIQSGGFGSFSKRYGTAAAGLLQAEVVTADGEIRVVNACNNADLFWALKGGGGGTFGVISNVTLALHDLPGFFGVANFAVKAASDSDFRLLLRQFVRFYGDQLFNEHWGEQARIGSGNTLEISMLSQGLDTNQANNVWQPFLDWVKRSPKSYAFTAPVTIFSWPAQRMWDVQWWKEHVPVHVFDIDDRLGAHADSAWWNVDAGQVGWFIWGYESLWLPSSLLGDPQERLADALFAASRHYAVALHFNKGLAGASSDTIAAAKDTAMNPAVLTSFALAIAANGEGPSYPGIAGYEPHVADGRETAERITRCIDELRMVAGKTGAYVSESNYFEKDFQHAYWGSNYARLAEIKKRYDPDGLFFVHNGVGSEQWSSDGFTRI